MEDWRDMYPGNEIHPTAIIDSSVKMGRGNVVGPFTIIGPDVFIKSNNHFYGHCSIGLSAQHRSFSSGHEGWTQIGSDNHIREGVTIHRSTTVDGTIIEHGCYIMAGAHVPHDAMIESDVTMCNNVLLGGHTHVMKGATLGLGSIVHQWSVIGAYAMLGMATVVIRDSEIHPCHKYVGSPARCIGLNNVGIDRAKLSGPAREELINRYWKLKGSR